MADRVFMNGGVGAEELSEVLTGDFLDVSLEGFDNVRRDGWRSTGAREFRSIELQAFYPGVTESLISVYVCEDITGIDVVDADGTSVVSDSRPDTTIFEATFDVVDDRLLLSGRDVWKNVPC